jgi:hypothetical protein
MISAGHIVLALLLVGYFVVRPQLEKQSPSSWFFWTLSKVPGALGLSFAIDAVLIAIHLYQASLAEDKTGVAFVMAVEIASLPRRMAQLFPFAWFGFAIPDLVRTDRRPPFLSKGTAVAVLLVGVTAAFGVGFLVWTSHKQRRLWEELAEPGFSRAKYESAFADAAAHADVPILARMAGLSRTPPSLLLRLAERPEPSVRQTLALNPCLPSSVGLRLSKDEDPLVRIRLASNTAAPREILLEMVTDANKVVRKNAYVAMYNWGKTQPSDCSAQLR